MDLGIGWIAGPVVVLRRPGENPLIANKIMFRDGAMMVLSCPTRLLWAGPDGMAYDLKPASKWSNMGATRANGIITFDHAR